MMQDTGYNGAQVSSSSALSFEKALLRDYCEIPEIQFLDDYIFLKAQLEEMRARRAEFVAERFAMEIAVILTLQDYDISIGLPMPLVHLPHRQVRSGRDHFSDR